ncbi:MAG TPA: GH92 family glycosyl hydrolase [Jatrophihabitans sp.]|jgi:predicted alpha-1,2-mannosidase
MSSRLTDLRGRRSTLVAAVACALLLGGLVQAGPVRATPKSPGVLVSDPTQYVDPMIGTGNGGDVVGDINDFPGVDTPFGMMQLSPDTQGSGEGYSYGKSSIRGFSLDHASAGCGIFGDVPILPTAGAIGSNPGSATATFSHDNEHATLGSYNVLLTDSNIHTSLTATSRTGLLTFQYPAGSTANVLIKSGASLAGNSAASVDVNGSHEVSGSATANGLCGQGSYTVYFDVQFSQPFSAHGAWQGTAVTAGSSSATGPGSGAYLTFDTSASKTVQAKVSMSYVSVDGARNNMAQEIHGWNPKPVEEQTWNEWRDALRTVQVGGGTNSDLTTFYTALYHSLQFPSVFNDVDGRYMGFDNNVHQVPSAQTQYATFSDWDTYRALAPLQTMLFPKQAADMANSLIRDAQQQGGWMPRWPLANVSTTGTMNGDNAVPLIANTVAFGAKNVDIAAALPIMLKGATQSEKLGWGWQERQCVEEYVKLGYAPNDACSQGSHGRQGVSETLEWSIDDFAISQLAASVGNNDTASQYQQRSQNWQNTFNPTTGYLQPRDELGAFPNGPAFVTPPAKAFGQDGYDEGNAADYGWEVPQNMAGLIGAMGGKDVAIPRLDTFFGQDNAGPNAPYMWAGNEVDLSVPYVYDYLGQPWKTQAQVRKQEQELYPPTPNGLPGNDDLGAMSSWYVWSALGMFPVTPGKADLALGSPLFKRAALHLGNGGTINVNAPAAADNAPYVTGVKLNGRSATSTGLPESFATSGGGLDFSLSSSPDTQWAISGNASPPSYQTGQDPAIGFTNPSGPITVTAVDTIKVAVGAQGTGLKATAVQWSAHASDGIAVSPASGTLNVSAGGRISTDASVTVPSSVASGYYPVTFDFTTSDGLKVPGGVLVMTVQADDHTAIVADDLGNPDVANGLNVVEEGDGHTTATTAGGLPGRTTTGTGSSYMYMNVDNTLVPGGDYQATAYVSYFDHGTGSWNIQYDSAAPDSAYQNSPRITDTNTDTWKTAVIPLPGAAFSSRENGSTDLRLSIGTGVQVIGRVAFSVTGANVLAMHLASAQPTAPVVTTQPMDATATAGSVSFTAAATGDPKPVVQWQAKAPGGDWSAVSGATDTTLTLANPRGYTDGTQFRAAFSNLAGGAFSDPATLHQ